MNVIAAAAATDAEPIGPGRLVLVVGPSGAGKDAILTAVKARCAKDKTLVFPRRIVTRPATADEDHISISHSGFGEALRSRAFAVWWQAHGLKYALPISVDTDISSGRTVVCNVSRGVVENSRLRYRDVTSVLITARPDLLIERLKARSRSSDSSIEDRVDRNAIYARFSADIVIDNSGALEEAVQALVSILGHNVA
jgi:ribose 1,5-bisphosphokinase